MNREPKRRHSAQITAVLLVCVAGALSLALGRSSTASGTPAPPALSAMSAQGGAALRLVTRDEPLVRAAAKSGRVIADVRVLGKAAGTTLYRVGSAPGCYATGPGLNGIQVAQLFCTEGFPSAGVPVVPVMKVQGTTPADPGTITAVGVAADGVAAVEFRDSAGTPVATSAVRGNVFGLDAVPSVIASEFVALDRAGNVIYSAPTGP